MSSGSTRNRASPLREFELIRLLHRRFGRSTPSVIRGIGEDAAVIKTSAKDALLATTDLLAEGIHFDLAHAGFETVGYRAAIANLSDIAAMGGTPRFLFVALAIPAHYQTSQIIALYRGLMRACRPFDVCLTGGDTSASRQGLFLSITLLGTMPAKQALRRNGARIGDLIYVTGTLGDSRAGLQLLMSGRNRSRRSAPRRHALTRHDRFLIRRHLHPSARIAEGRLLASARLASAAIDISDGLSGDLRHLCEQSGVGAEIFLSKLPVSPACHAYAQQRRLDPAQQALSGGEDYELLFTVPPRRRAQLDRLGSARGFRLTCIGEIRPAHAGITTRGPDGTVRPLRVTSYEHFHRST